MIQTLNSQQLYTNPTRRIFGEGTFSRLPELVKEFKPEKILLVLGENSFRQSPHYSEVLIFLETYEILESLPIGPNPEENFIQSEINRLKDQAYQLVIAVGGGSVLDVAKILAHLPQQPQTSLQEYLAGKKTLSAPGVPLIAIPTTSGTGSEVTPYASLETVEKKKVTFSDPDFYPEVAIIDPVLTYSMPSYITASTGFDALSQAIESYWAVAATAFSRTHALRALDLILPHLETAVKDPKNQKARSAIALGSCEAGLAIAQTKTTAVHSVSYPITAHFRVAHGHACALTLSSFIKFNSGWVSEAESLLRICRVSDFARLAAQVETLMKAAALETSLGKLGINEAGIELILRDGFRPDRILNNPRHVEADDLRQILHSIA